MNIIFVGGYFPGKFNDLLLSKSKLLLQNAANTFQWAFIKGMEKIMGHSMKLITAPFIGWYPRYYKDIRLKTADFPNNEIENAGIMVGFINLPVIKNVHKYLQLKKQISKAVFKENKTVIVVYSLATAYLRAAVEIKRIHSNVKICVIITDLHEFPGDCSFFQKAYINYIEKPIFYKLLSQIDCFVVVTEKIIEYLGVENKPWVRVEGLYDPSEPAQLPQVDNKNLKVILYAGTLHTRYGIGELLDAFKMIKADDYRLWICGDGGGIELVKNAALTDERIKYLGIVPKQKVSELQRQATILINPRNTNGEYNKYSFPSKTIEYLSSGTPALMYKLDGIPEEYYEYCYTISGSSIEDMSKAMYEVCQLDDKTLKSKGTLAREFILNNKSSEIQCKKILAMLKKL